ncbi:hypothetical protein PB01_03735 [Psychrobacillus glaciei]|uniref:Uncharacterized protein n=1 Tax=Psychrobacillus glaciei TaxID=2283160 RepID=A0A5J6SJY2_9BACI|nr:hypothetical protein [Psychrobacillus glaciei]QFF97999.1 hypothetical protein PB01_03735 [Psychrobacillus glaciei]
MRSIFLLSALFISFSFLVIQSDSYSIAGISSDATISLVPEGEALIAINYDVENRKIMLTNNTEKTGYIESINPDGYFELLQGVIGSGETIVSDVIGKSDDLSGQNISIKVRWSEGSALISSILPVFAEELIEESLVEPTEGEVDNEEPIEVEPEETTTPEENEEADADGDADAKVEEIQKIDEPITIQPDVKK